MLLAFIFVLVVIGFGILISLYSTFLPFFENLNNIVNYNSAYYGAVSSIERGLLITKYQKPGFQGTGGRIDNNCLGPISDDKNGNLGRLEREGNNMYRNILSRTNLIPEIGKGNINYLLLGTGSENYNKLSYNKIEQFLLSVDNTNIYNDYYKKDGNVVDFQGSSIFGKIRLPIKIFNEFGGSLGGLLCDSANIPECDLNNDNIFDEIAVQWSLNGLYNDMDFLIIPYTHVFLNQNPVSIDELYDTNIRENTINYTTENIGNSVNIEFSDSLYNIFNPVISNTMSLVSGHNIIIKDDSNIIGKNYRQIFQVSKNLLLKFGIGPLLFSQNGNIYPFLEYQFEFSEPVSDRFYNIMGVGQIGSYKVEILLKKPTVNQNLSSDFTIIF